MPELIIHPGSPKTGTTALQVMLRRHRSAIESDGVTKLLLPENFRGNPFLGNYLRFYRSDEPADSHRAAATSYFAPYQKFSRVIISEETFTHDFMPSRSLGEGGIDRAERFVELVKQWPFDRVTVVLTVRNQVSFLVSTYSHWVHRHRERRRFADWLAADVNVHNLSWSPVVSALGDFADFVVIPFEETIANGLPSYLSRVLTGMAINHEGMDLSMDQAHNESPSKRAIEVMLQMNRVIEIKSKAELLNDRIAQVFPRSESGRFSPQGDWRETIAELYRDDNRSLSAEHFPDLAGVFCSSGRP